ncbi:MAG: hypothetical protein BWX71_02492 [Deltaproteobacteria bacterium ADurb.Bin072]|nr:MAG: hypothetical protein BWX71_02492 [Deltaproteobacteria bacterium ADurb.Bin072]
MSSRFSSMSSSVFCFSCDAVLRACLSSVFSWERAFSAWMRRREDATAVISDEMKSWSSPRSMSLRSR